MATTVVAIGATITLVEVISKVTVVVQYAIISILAAGQHHMESIQVLAGDSLVILDGYHHLVDKVTFFFFQIFRNLIII